jgi:hypothetical protein
MDTADLLFLPRSDDPIDDDLDAALREIDVAIEMVVRGAAVRVRLVGLSDPDTLAPIALARAQLAGVEFHLDRAGSTPRLTFGPSD